MEYTYLTEEELADNFERVAGDFHRFIEDNGLENTSVDMATSYDNRSPDLNLCDTPACHGGWAAIMYGIKGDSSIKSFFELGVSRLAGELGFSCDFDVMDWTIEYPEYWGNEYGEWMFDSKEAFGKDCGEPLSLKDIADWYMSVARRLRGEDV